MNASHLQTFTIYNLFSLLVNPCVYINSYNNCVGAHCVYTHFVLEDEIILAHVGAVSFTVRYIENTSRREIHRAFNNFLRETKLKRI